jgi:hypothetical protein
MNTENPISCPVDFVLMNEHKARLIALQVFLSTTLIALFHSWILIVMLVADFFIRAFSLGKYSAFAKAADILIRIFNIGSKPVDQAPKRFAARIGLIFSAAMLLSQALNYPVITTALAGVLILFSFLESVFAFCAGCHVYTIIQRFTNPPTVTDN